MAKFLLRRCFNIYALYLRLNFISDPSCHRYHFSRIFSLQKSEIKNMANSAIRPWRSHNMKGGIWIFIDHISQLNEAKVLVQCGTYWEMNLMLAVTASKVVGKFCQYAATLRGNRWVNERWTTSNEYEYSYPCDTMQDGWNKTFISHIIW